MSRPRALWVALTARRVWRYDLARTFEQRMIG